MGEHNRGVFNQTLAKKGVRFNPVGLEPPEQIGRLERRNQTLKHMMAKVIKEINGIGRQAMGMVLTEYISAIIEMFRHVVSHLSNGYSHDTTLGDEISNTGCKSATPFWMIDEVILLSMNSAIT